MAHWEDLLVHGQKYQYLDHVNGSSSGTGWLAWGQQARKRMVNLDLEHYRAALQWHTMSATSSCDAQNTLSEIVLLPELTESLTSGEWTENLLAKEKRINEQHLSAEHQPLLHQLFCAEMPWLIGCMFPDLTVGQRMVQL